MTALTARATGCPTVGRSQSETRSHYLGSQRHIMSRVLISFGGVGGAQAIAIMAYRVTMAGETDTIIPPCAVICGPGNQWVTAAKSIVQGKCGIDM
mmetsp:Transcript_8296/g.8130  ORF Transcript_8296/g.8130 Transcript_8296/m.8130 type:complete len:96 (-) Transcript_8296:1298-1585(-)